MNKKITVAFFLNRCALRRPYPRPRPGADNPRIAPSSNRYANRRNRNAESPDRGSYPER